MSPFPTYYKLLVYYIVFEAYFFDIIMLVTTYHFLEGMYQMFE